ncbi:MAG: DUF3575 domain-containing protein [Alistipes sp.]
MNHKRHLFLVLTVALATLCASQASGQNLRGNYDTYLPVLAVKTNALYWATTTPNLGIEIGLGKRLTLDVSANYNPWKFEDNKKMKHWMIQPELRVWMCERFQGHFLGVHMFYADYNMGGMGIFGMKDYRYDGTLCGMGISYGYQWIIGRRWNLEATIGFGYAHLKYDKYVQNRCGAYLGSDTENYFGPTKVGISFVYIIK